MSTKVLNCFFLILVLFTSSVMGMERRVGVQTPQRSSGPPDGEEFFTPQELVEGNTAWQRAMAERANGGESDEEDENSLAPRATEGRIAERSNNEAAEASN